MPECFKAPLLKFDHVPCDDELVSLLGERFCVGEIVVEEAGPELIARPGRIPLQFVIPWIVFTGVMIVGGLWLGPHESPRTLEDRRQIASFTAFVCATVSLMLGAVVVMNHFLKAKGNYLHADKGGKWLELCPIKKAFAAEQILAFTQLTRYYHPGVLTGEWIRQMAS